MRVPAKAADVLPLHEADLRATSVTWMAMGGAAIARLVAFYDSDGEAEFGL